MTIAACHVSPEGVVFGCDSTTTIQNHREDGIPCHFDHAQKVFEVGEEGSTVGLVTWGLGSIGETSHRSMAHELGRFEKSSSGVRIKQMAEHLGKIVWDKFQSAYKVEIDTFKSTLEKFEKGEEPSEEEIAIAQRAMTLEGGYCVGGRVGDEECAAYELRWHPALDQTMITQVPLETPKFWGVPTYIERLVYGADPELAVAIKQSGKWSGTDDELFDLITSFQLIHPHLLPLREAIDWIHTVIHTTIRAIKFAKEPHYCGGPIEIAVISNDRPFRWVQHKGLDSAIGRESR